jgi:Na+/glutamate symporter
LQLKSAFKISKQKNKHFLTSTCLKKILIFVLCVLLAIIVDELKSELFKFELELGLPTYKPSILFEFPEEARLLNEEEYLELPFK